MVVVGATVVVVVGATVVVVVLGTVVVVVLVVVVGTVVVVVVVHGQDGTGPVIVAEDAAPPVKLPSSDAT